MAVTKMMKIMMNMTSVSRMKPRSFKKAMLSLGKSAETLVSVKGPMPASVTAAT